MGNSPAVFCYVDDLIDDMIRLMHSCDGFTRPVSIGHPNELTMLDLVEKVIQLRYSSNKIIFKPLPEEHPLQRELDIAFAKKELDGQPHIQLEEGLRKTIAYFRSVI